VIPKRIRDAALPKAVWLIDGEDLHRTGNQRLRRYIVRIVHDQVQPDASSAKGLRLDCSLAPKARA
jgi:hypothetical protein